LNEAELRTFLEKQDKEIMAVLDKNTLHAKTLDARILQLEQRAVSRGGGPGGGDAETIGALVTGHDGWKAFRSGAPSSGHISIGSFHNKATIISPGGQNQPLVPDMRVPGIVGPGQFPLGVRDGLSVMRTESNLVQFTLETSFTNAAGMQPGEGTAKPESAMTFSLQNAAVQTLAHWIPVSRQVLDDSVSLQDYLNQRLVYGLKLVEENQLLNGNGIGQNLKGLVTSATPYAGGSSGSLLDVLGSALAQVEASGYKPDRVILHPQDAWQLYLIKTTYGEYVYSNPLVATQPQVWSVPITTSISMQRGAFLVGAFKMAAAIWDRWDATIEVSREHQDFFVKNLVAILCEERLALTVFRPSALIYGTFPVGS
jgi:HK97 family phage major capsid protein